MPSRPWTRAAPTLTPEGEAFICGHVERHHAHREPERFRGVANGRAKLTEAAVRDIVRPLADGTAGTGALAREYGVTTETIRRIRSGETWVHVERPEPPPRPDPAPAPMPPRPDGEKQQPATG